ncbi:MAG TPA: 30S ribosomal protein S3 [Candidatus Saccharimonadales bacterium]|nr:30S ribosomal protein S3 [Candidatus Saccharimonadales bacterium]
MPIHTYFVRENARRAEIDEYLSQELKRAGYSKVEMTKTPLGTRVVIYAAKPGLVIGRRGQSIRDLTKILEEKFGVENPQISVATVEIPELDPKVVASQIAMALQRGIHFRRAAYWALQRTIEAGALGVEISIRGKLTTDRARYEKYRSGYLPAVGEAISRILRTAVVDTQLKQGLFGISVKLMPPNVQLPDRPTIKETEQAPTIPKPVLDEVVPVELTTEIKEVAEIADTKKA